MTSPQGEKWCPKQVAGIAFSDHDLYSHLWCRDTRNSRCHEHEVPLEQIGYRVPGVCDFVHPLQPFRAGRTGRGGAGEQFCCQDCSMVYSIIHDHHACWFAWVAFHPEERLFGQT